VAHHPFPPPPFFPRLSPLEQQRRCRQRDFQSPPFSLSLPAFRQPEKRAEQITRKIILSLSPPLFFSSSPLLVAGNAGGRIGEQVTVIFFLFPRGPARELVAAQGMMQPPLLF